MIYNPAQKRQYESARDITRLVNRNDVSPVGCIARGFLLGAIVLGMGCAAGKSCSSETQKEQSPAEKIQKQINQEYR
ncbi:hypothetical protein JXB27_02405 [Candidatus Woesearchaeota archaeon]|nr:hypothetical protein [Candidatus Woesearchaeota archaeon]